VFRDGAVDGSSNSAAACLQARLGAVVEGLTRHHICSVPALAEDSDLVVRRLADAEKLC
jgi:hypothetical protein